MQLHTRSRRRLPAAALLSLVLALGCDSSPSADAAIPDAAIDTDAALDTDAAVHDAGPTDAGIADASPADSGADAGRTDGGSRDGGTSDAGVTDAGPPTGLDSRLVTPWSGSRVSSRRPLFRTAGGGPAIVEVCADSACSTVEATLSGAGPLRPAADLAFGLHWARARADVASVTFGETLPFVVSTGGDGQAQRLGYFDVNGDGFEDALTIDYGFGDPTAQLRLGSATGPGSIVWSLGFFGGSFEDTRVQPVGDVNGDGLADVAAQVDGSVSLFFGGASGLPAAPDQVIRPSGATFCGPGWGPAGDIDRDGFADVLLSCERSDLFGEYAVEWLRGSPDGLVSAGGVTTVAFGATGEHIGGFDINGDGFGDAMVRRDALYLGASDGLGAMTAELGPCQTAEGTMDSDGDSVLEIVVRGRRDGAFCDHRWLSHATLDGAELTLSAGYSIPNAIGQAFGRDVDGDRRDDFLLFESRIGSQSVLVLFPGGDAEPPTPLDIAVLGGSHLSMWDADGDGIADITAEQGANVVWYRGATPAPDPDTAVVLTP